MNDDDIRWPESPTLEGVDQEELRGCVILEPASMDKAIVGYTKNDAGEVVLVYGYEELIEQFQEDNDWNCEEAMEWVEYDTIRALPYMGPRAPRIRYEDDEDEEDEEDEEEEITT